MNVPSWLRSSSSVTGAVIASQTGQRAERAPRSATADLRVTTAEGNGGKLKEDDDGVQDRETMMKMMMMMTMLPTTSN